jgi:hypothetical protein
MLERPVNLFSESNGTPYTAGLIYMDSISSWRDPDPAWDPKPDTTSLPSTVTCAYTQHTAPSRHPSIYAKQQKAHALIRHEP